MFHNKSLVEETTRLHKFSLRLTKNTANSDDLLQSTLLRALENRHRFQDGSNLFHWTSRIMFNIFVSDYRRQKKYSSQYDPEPIINNLQVAANQETCTDLSLVGEAMEKLSHEHREVLILICIQGNDYAEAARVLDLPLGTIRSRLSRARIQLTNILKPDRATLH